MENKDLVLNQYLDYTMDDLEVEEQLQLERESNLKLSRVIRRDAMDRLEVIEHAKEIYLKAIEYCNEKGIDFSSEITFRDAIFIATGKDVDDLAGGPGLSENIDRFAASAMHVLKTGAGRLGNWLTRVSQK